MGVNEFMAGIDNRCDDCMDRNICTSLCSELDLAIKTEKIANEEGDRMPHKSYEAKETYIGHWSRKYIP